MNVNVLPIESKGYFVGLRIKHSDNPAFDVYFSDFLLSLDLVANHRDKLPDATETFVLRRNRDLSGNLMISPIEDQYSPVIKGSTFKSPEAQNIFGIFVSELIGFLLEKPTPQSQINDTVGYRATQATTFRERLYEIDTNRPAKEVANKIGKDKGLDAQNIAKTFWLFATLINAAKEGHITSLEDWRSYGLKAIESAATHYKYEDEADRRIIDLMIANRDDFTKSGLSKLAHDKEGFVSPDLLEAAVYELDMKQGTPLTLANTLVSSQLEKK